MHLYFFKLLFTFSIFFILSQTSKEMYFSVQDCTSPLPLLLSVLVAVTTVFQIFEGFKEKCSFLTQ